MTAFLMADNAGSRPFRATVHRPSPKYDSFAVKRGEKAPPNDLEFRWKMGSKTLGDVVLTDDIELLGSARFLKSIEGLPGWSSVPVNLVLPTGQPVNGFHCLIITGRTGAFLQNRTTKLPAGPNK